MQECGKNRGTPEPVYAVRPHAVSPRFLPHFQLASTTRLLTCLVEFVKFVDNALTTASSSLSFSVLGNTCEVPADRLTAGRRPGIVKSTHLPINLPESQGH